MKHILLVLASFLAVTSFAVEWKFDGKVGAKGAPVDFEVPKGAFRFEAEFEAGPLGQDGTECYSLGARLFDGLSSKDKRGLDVSLHAWRSTWGLTVGLGYGDEVVKVSPANRLPVKPGDRIRVAFVFGADGTVVIDYGGRTTELSVPRYGALPPAPVRQATIGRPAPTSKGPVPFNGRILRVSVEDLGPVPFAIVAKGPLARVRATPDAMLSFDVRNLCGEPVTEAGAEVIVDGQPLVSRNLGNLPKEGSAVVTVPFETRVRPGWRKACVTVFGKTPCGASVRRTCSFRVGVGPRRSPRLEMMMGDMNTDVSPVGEMGFTAGGFGDGGHFTVRGTPPESDPMFRTFCTALDEATVRGVSVLLGAKGEIVLPPGSNHLAFARHLADGSTKKSVSWRGEDLEVGDPQLCAAGARAWRQWAKTFAAYPSLMSMKPFSEFRDGVVPSYGGGDAARFRAETGLKMPPADLLDRAVAKRSVMGKLHPTWIIPDDDPVLAFLRWYWSGGDGWPRYLSVLSSSILEGAAEAGRTTFETMWDPGVRCPPRWGSGGSVTQLSQWVYPDPEPMSVAGPAEEILAMTAGCSGQKPRVSIQLMAYRSRVAPEGQDPEDAPAWTRRFASTRFVAQPEDVVTEAVWSALAKPMSSYGFYPWHTLIETGADSGYVFSNPKLPETMRHLLKDVIAPLGPTLLKIGRIRPDIAVFESFTAVAMGGASYGSGWHAAGVTMLQRARLDPRVVYEETVERDGLEDVKVLYAPECRALTASMLERLQAFRARGGLLVCDRAAPSTIKRDFDVDYIRFAQPPDMDYPEFVQARATKSKAAVNRVKTKYAKSSMVACAEKLRQQLAGKYRARSDSSSAEIVVYNRRWRETDYLFAVSDKRTFGDYVGPWGLVMERGEPNEGWVSLDDPSGRVKAVYELSRGGELPFTREGDSVRVPLAFETCDGRFLAFLPEKIASVELQAERRGDELVAEMRVIDAVGRPADAALPVEIRVYDAAGVEIDGAGYLCAEGGVARVVVPLNANDAQGDYRVVCRDRASGLSKSCCVR